MICEWIACNNKTIYNKNRNKYNRFCCDACIKNNHRNKDKDIIVGYTQGTCINSKCNKTFIYKRSNQLSCGLEECKKFLKNKESKKRRSKNKNIFYCECGNVSHNQFGKNKICKTCIVSTINKHNWIVLSDIPQHYNTYIRVECKACRNESHKQVSHLTNNNAADKNCNNCTRANLSKHYNKSDKGYFYLLENDLFYKYGVSYRIDERISEHKRSNLNHLITISFSTLEEAYSFEKLVKDYVKENNLEFTSEYNFRAGGKTETIDKNKTQEITAMWLLNLIREKNDTHI